MRILSILLFSPPSKTYGGAELQMHSLHKGLISKGVDVNVLANIERVGAIVQEYEGVKVWGFKVPMPRRIMLHPLNVIFYMEVRKMVKFVKERIGRTDLIQVTPFREPGMFAYWISKELGIPWVGRIAGSGLNGDFNFMSRNWLTRRLLPQVTASCSATVVLDQETYQEAIANGIAEEKIKIIPNALILEDIPALETVKDEPARGFILFLGRVGPQKRLESLVKGYVHFKAIWTKKEDKNPPKLKIIGGGEAGYINKLSAQAGVSDHIEFMGHRRDIKPLLSAALCLINPSESEGFPNAVLEASAFGVPVILSDIPVHRRIAKETGMEQYLFPVGEDRILAERLFAFFKLPKGERIQKRVLSARFGQRFSKENRDKEYIELYERVTMTEKSRRNVG
jgi:glycosyltransferase involved in cell wall biosynthesis